MGGPEVKSMNLIFLHHFICWAFSKNMVTGSRVWHPIRAIWGWCKNGSWTIIKTTAKDLGLCLLGPQASWGPSLRSQHEVHFGPPQEIGQSTSQKTCHSSPYWHTCRYTPHLFSSINRKWIPCVSEDARSHVNAAYNYVRWYGRYMSLSVSL